MKIEDDTNDEDDDNSGSCNDDNNNQVSMPDGSMIFVVGWRSWQCPLCDVVLANKRSKYQHMKTHRLTKAVGSNEIKCPDCSSTFVTMKSYNLHHETAHPPGHQRRNICLNCSKSFDIKDQDAFHDHVKSHYSNTDTASAMTLECLMCFGKFANSVELGNHYVLKHGKDRNQRYHCPLCNKNYAGQGSLKEHLLVKHLDKKLHQCSICKKEFARNDNMMKHMKSVHKQMMKSLEEGSQELEEKGEEVSLECESEGNNDEKVSKSKSMSPFIPEKKCSHNQPMLNLDKKTPGVCPTCGFYCIECSYIFENKKKFSGHTHDNLCKQCGLKFRNKKLYTLHLQYHKRKGIAGKCEDCRFGLKSHEMMQNHLRIWHGLKTLSCSICGKTFKSKNNLHVHKQIHKERKHFCTVCSKAFLTNSHLKRHMQIHSVSSFPDSTDPVIQIEDGSKIQAASTSSERDTYEDGQALQNKVDNNRNNKKESFASANVCTVCHKSFSRLRDLRLHQNCHNNDGKPKPNKCPKCSKSYLKPQGLTIHLMKNHDFQPLHLCEPCGLPFSSKAAFEKHNANKSCEKRKASRKRELQRRVERARKVNFEKKYGSK